MKSYYKMHILTTENIDLNLPYEIIKEILSYVIEPWKPE
jgi:hypothetical protein